MKKTYLLLFITHSLISVGCVQNTIPINSPVIKTSSDNKCQFGDKLLLASESRVIDGDTIEIKLNNGVSERVRLIGIDAPEKDQAYGHNSTKNLLQCIDDEDVRIEWLEKDRYKRILGKVIVNGKDCNLEQIKQGSAWHYTQYQNNQTEYDRLSYSNAETLARNEMKGLWSSPKVVAPWDFRKGSDNQYNYNTELYSLEGASCTNEGKMASGNLLKR